MRAFTRLWLHVLTIRPNCGETLSESQELPNQACETGALAASKVYYYLGQYDDALSLPYELALLSRGNGSWKGQRNISRRLFQTPSTGTSPNKLPCLHDRPIHPPQFQRRLRQDIPTLACNYRAYLHRLN
ncbi:hypothetical protein FRC08_014659 [Ceratobasidium sp. 394]|nr:hypothetical protein FRC08_014659 [Ceratobasidium sp. 394]